jgi:hypothetical protein
MLLIIMLNVDMLSVIMLNVVAPVLEISAINLFLTSYSGAVVQPLNQYPKIEGSIPAPAGTRIRMRLNTQKNINRKLF